MKIILIIVALIILPAISHAQYWQERTTEHNFEQSNLFFKSHYLNPYGIEHLKDISAGFIDDPFLNVHLNPSFMPKLKNGTTEIYLDFRGDRTESKLVSGYSVPAYYDDYYGYSSYRPDYRQITETRNESEPIFSLGFLSYPLESLDSSFYIGGSFQYLNAKDKFYSPTFGYYTKNFYADGYSSRLAESSAIPTIDRYSAKDEMIQKAILATAYTGYRINDNFSIGLNINSVTFERTGDYLNEHNDEYGNIDNSEYSSKNFKSRDQNYDHFDFALGLTYYNNTDDFLIGIKGGILTGDVTQNHLSQNSYVNRHNEPEISDEWYYHYSDYNNSQNWDHDGNTKYLGFNYRKKISSSSLQINYKYTSTKIDAETTSALFDTSYSSNRWYNSYDNIYSRSSYNSMTNDVRSGNGDRDSKTHEFMLNINWVLTKKTKVHTGFYFNTRNSTIENIEYATYNNNYDYVRTGLYPNNNNYKRFEDKTLTWNYENEHTSFQIPIIFDFTVDDKFGIMLGINRVFKDWSIKSTTSVYFAKRTNEENGVVKEESNFIERYIQPSEKYTEDYTDVFTKFNVGITEQLQASLLINPEFEDTFRIAQWWLSFRANL